jgi:hypothetical protein
VTQSISLKWGTLKGWSDLSSKSVEIGNKVKWSTSPMMQKMDDEHKEVLCELIDNVVAEGGEIHDDWNGGTMTAEAAKKYVMEYRS